LVGDDGRDEKQEDGSVDNAPSGGGLAEDWLVSNFAVSKGSSREMALDIPSFFATDITRLAVQDPVDQREDVDND